MSQASYASYRPGIICRVVDHPVWKSPLKRWLIGAYVVLICRNDRIAVPGWLRRGWRVSGIPPEYVKARLAQGAKKIDSLAECILEPLPPIDLEADEQSKETLNDTVKMD